MISLTRYINEDFKISQNTKNELNKKSYDDIFKYIFEDDMDFVKIAKVHHLSDNSKPSISIWWIIPESGQYDWSKEIYVLDDKHDDIGEELFKDLESLRLKNISKNDFIRKWIVEEIKYKNRHNVYKVTHYKSNVSFNIYLNINLG